MASVVQQTETAFGKAINYLNYDRTAKWCALAAGAGTALVLVALLGVLWLFGDLLVWRGRVPALRELSAKQLDWVERSWNAGLPEERQTLLRRARYETANVARLSGLSFAELADRDRELIWEELAYRILYYRVGADAVERVFPPSDETQSGFVLDGGNHGVLSLAVREVASDRLWTPVPWLASWNRWMWNATADAPTPLPMYLTGLAAITLLLGLAWALLLVVNRLMAARATIEASNRLRRAVYHHTFRLGTLAVRALGPSEAVSILTRHIEAVHDALYTYLTVSYRETITFALLLLFAFLVSPLLTLAFLLTGLIVWQVGVRLVGALTRRAEQATHVAAERLTVIRESLMLMRLVKCYHMEQFNQARIERQLSRYAAEQAERYRAETLVQPALYLVGGLGALLLLFVGSMLVLYGDLNAAGGVVLIAALLGLYGPAVRLLDARKTYRRGRDGAELVFAFLERRGEVGQVVGAEFLPPVAKQIEFDNVTLRDPSNNRVLLEEVNLTIPAGERVGLVGADNLEKHALVYLIPRLLDPSAGEIRIDQHNLRWVTLDSLRAQVAIVMMHNLVFHDTVRNNIGCGDSTHTLPQIIEAAKVAHAHQFIQKLPDGYETPIGELGHPLSLSQQYRIALARAILRDPALLILEEPETDLDDDTKDLLDDTLARFLPGRTVIFLPHRISTLKSCDRIYLMSKGRVVAASTHKELLAGNKLYRHLHYLEFNQMDEVV